MTGKTAIRHEARHTLVENPTILTIKTASTVFHTELRAVIEGVIIGLDATSQIILMYQAHPPVAKLFFQCAPSELEPTSIEIGATFVRISHPKHYRGRFRP